jgi:hypothetical protein
MTGDHAEPTTEEQRPGDPIKAAAGAARPDPVRAEISLASYVDALTPGDFTVEAKAAVLSDIRDFATELCSKTATYQQLDEHAEAALRKHVRAAASSITRGKDGGSEGSSKVSEWCKWIGFAFLAFAVQQFQKVTGEKPIAQGSVRWLVADIIITMLLLVVGFMIDRPLEVMAKIFRRKPKPTA